MNKAANLVAAGRVSEVGIMPLSTAEMAQALKQVYIEAGTQWGWYWFKRFKTAKSIDIEFYNDLVTFIEQYFQSNLLTEAVLPIDNYTRQIIQQIITRGIQNGDGYIKIAERLRDAQIPRIRAERIVRTETAKAANVGAVQGAKKSGLVMDKVWISAQDNRTRRIPRDKTDHLHMNGVTVAMDEPFIVSGEPMMQPAQPKASAANVINCRCTVGFEPRRDANGRLIRTEQLPYVQLP
jgi:SPP1 gp7 family putative phage head morphogenesis protein